MRAGLGLLVALLGLAACVPGLPIASPMSHSCTTTIIGPDGKPQQAVIEADDAGAAALLCDGGAKPAPLPAPKPVAMPAPAPVQTRPARVARGSALVHNRLGGPGCGLRMVGGTGYVCASN